MAKKISKTSEKKIDQLNAKHKEFLLNYILLGQNGRKAYMMTYPKTKKEVADVCACQLLSKPKVSEALQEYLDELWKTKEREISIMFNKLVDTANADISDYIDEDGDIKVDEFDKLNTFPIAQYDKTVNQTETSSNIKQSIKLIDKLKAIDQLTKILGMIQEKVEHTGTIEIIPPKRPDEIK